MVRHALPDEQPHHPHEGQAPAGPDRVRPPGRRPAHSERLLLGRQSLVTDRADLVLAPVSVPPPPAVSLPPLPALPPLPPLPPLALIAQLQEVPASWLAPPSVTPCPPTDPDAVGS